ncbi:phosphoribosylpyrophosphate synthetase [Thalassospira sp.]|uniref:phosphoribosylpyrophosphate synthetase n=1 Tax=Thalassospira sp. TaxID=1912094 RepID=UPI0027349AB7|nr:phosphoribosylpyrophosphate synthetase [Thalassospira sp.]MDP2699284.1 phosphoribosylpyrophosphate synthetase [Thalassospira sp.]
MMNVAELQEQASRKGFSHSFIVDDDGVRCDGEGKIYQASDLKIIHSEMVGEGTDPGDDATLYMIEARDGAKGTMIIPSSFHTDQNKADLIDHLRNNAKEPK